MAICPLLLISVKHNGLITDPEKTWAGCLRENCEWFVRFEPVGAGRPSSPNEGCAIKKISESMHHIESQAAIQKTIY